MYNIYYKRMKLKLIHVNVHGKGSFIQKLFNTQNNLTQKFCDFWYKPGPMCTLTHLPDLAMVEDVIITCVCGYIYSITDWPGV